MEDKRPLQWGWFVLGAGFLTTFVSYSIRLGFGVILPEMMTSLNLSKAEGGRIYSVFLACYTIFSPIAGYLSDRFGGRRVIALFCAILGLGLLSVGAADRLVTTILFFAVAGIGNSSTWVPVVSLTTKWFSAARRGFILGVLMVGSQTGYGVMGLVFPLLMARYPWRFGWTVLGLSALMIAVVNGLLLRSQPGKPDLSPGKAKEESKTPSTDHRSSYTEILRNGFFWQIGVSYFFISFCYYTFVSFVVAYGRIELGLAYGTASAFASVFSSSFAFHLSKLDVSDSANLAVLFAVLSTLAMRPARSTSWGLS